MANWNYVANEQFENVCVLDFYGKIYMMVRIEVWVLIEIWLLGDFDINKWELSLWKLV